MQNYRCERPAGLMAATGSDLLSRVGRCVWAEAATGWAAHSPPGGGRLREGRAAGPAREEGTSPIPGGPTIGIDNGAQRPIPLRGRISLTFTVLRRRASRALRVARLRQLRLASRFLRLVVRISYISF